LTRIKDRGTGGKDKGPRYRTPLEAQGVRLEAKERRVRKRGTMEYWNIGMMEW